MSKKKLIILSVLFLFLFVPNKVFGSTFIDQYLDQDGYLYIDSVTPTSADEALGIVQYYMEYNYNLNAYADNCNVDYSICDIKKGNSTVSTVKMKYNEEADLNKDIILSKVNTIQNKDTFELSDMHLVNYYLRNNKIASNSNENYKTGWSLNDSIFLKNKINDNAISIEINERKGADIGYFGDYLGGNCIVKYNNTIYSAGKIINLNLLRVIYIPEGAENSLEFAQIILNRFFGTNTVRITYGGSIPETNSISFNYSPYFNNISNITEDNINLTLQKSGGTYDHNYYKVNINNKDYYFLIVQNNEKWFREVFPTFVDPFTGIEVGTKEFDIPYSSETRISDVTSQYSNLGSFFNSDNYNVYDIQLNMIDNNYDVSNKNFDFKFPIPINYESADVYYYDNNSFVKCERTITNNYISVSNKKQGIYALVENKTEIWPEEISFDQENMSFDIDTYSYLNMNILPANSTRKEVTITSSNPEIADIEDGYLHTKQYGEVELTATTSNGVTATCTVTISEPIVEVQSLSFNHDSFSIEKNESIPLTVNVLPINSTNKEVTLESSNPNIVSIENGYAVGNNYGTATITATSNNGVTATCTVTVVEPSPEAQALYFEKDEYYIDKGMSQLINMTIVPSSASNTEISFVSYNPEIADIENGYIVGKEYGLTTIIATASNGVSTVCTVNVTPYYADPEDFSFNVTGDTLELDEGEKYYPNISFTPMNVSDRSIDWVIDNPSIIKLEDAGYFHALVKGTTTLTATTVNGITKTLTVIVKEPTDYLKKYKNPDTGEYEMYIGMYRPNNEDTLQLYIQSNIDSAILQKVRFTDFNFDLSSCKVTYPNGTEVNLKFIYMPNNDTYDTQLSKINNIPDRSSYELNDMDVINYYLYFEEGQSGSSERIEEKMSYGLNYSTKFHNDLNNYSICGRVIPRKGDIGIFNLYTGGNIEFNNCDRMNIYSMSKYVDYTFENVLYVPAGTQNYLSYIQNRINTFYGSNKVLVSEGGTITDLYNNEKSIIGRNNTEVFSSIDNFMIQYNEELQKYGGISNNKYYKLKINNNTYNFIIIENSSKMINYNSVKNISSFTNVEIESIDSSASNDLGNLTLMYESGNEVTEDFYSNALHLIDTNNYVIYKTQLYPFSSNIDTSKSYNIKIPILDRFKNKNIEVSNLKYSNGNPYKEKIDYTIKDNYIIIKNKLYDDINNKDYIIEEKTNRISYTTHVQNVGWQNYVHEGEMAGTSGRALRLEGIKIKVDNSKYSGDIEYRTHVQNVGWQDYVKNDEMSGTSGRALRLEAIQIRLTGEMAEHYDVYYRVHAQNFGWMNWAKNDEMAGTAGYAYRLEGIEIVLVEKGQNPPVASNLNYRYSFRNLNGDPREALIKYTTHVQNVGWQNLAYDGDMAGTSGRALRLEGIKIALANKKYSGDVEYKTHVQNIGWQDYVKNGEMSGTSGRALRLEAIQIRLTGEMAEHYDVYYRVHAQNVGWMNWAKNDEMSGTAGYAYRLEGIEIVLVEKGQNPPTRTNMNNSAFIQR